MELVEGEERLEHQDHVECAENAERVEHVECVEYTGVQRSAVGRRGVPRSTVETVKNLKYAVYVDCVGLHGRWCERTAAWPPRPPQV